MPSLDSLCDFIVDAEHKTAPKSETGQYPLVRTPNIGEGRFIFDGVHRIGEDTYQAWTRRATPKHRDLILAREAPIGNVAMVPKGIRPALGQRTVLIRPDEGRVDSRFLAYRLLGPDVQHAMNSMSSGATVPHLNMRDIRSLPLPSLPSKSTQHKIAAVLGAYDDLIEVNRRRIRVLEEMAQTIYREWFVNFRYPGHEKDELVETEIGPAPAGWEVGRVGQHIELRYGKALKKADRIGGAVPVFGSGGVVGWHDQALAQGPGIVVGRKGNVGSVYWSDLPFYPIDTTFFVESPISMYLLYYQLREMKFIDSHAAVPGLSRSQAYSLPLLVAPHATVDRFETIVKRFFELGSTLADVNQALTETRDLLLPRLVSGELDVSDLDIAGSEVDV